MVPVSYTHLDVYKRQFQTLEQIWEEYGVYQKAQDDQV